MPYALNDKIKNLVPYEPIKGDYAIRLDANESFIELPVEIYQAALEKAARVSLSRYPDSRAEGVCKAFADSNGTSLKNVVAGNGSDELISIIVGAFFESGDELITLSNDFSMYRFYCDVYGVNPTVFPKTKGLKINVTKLIDYANSSKAKGIIFSNPCNPTSLCLSKSEVMRLVSSVSCLVIVDEAYMDFTTGSVLSEASQHDNLIVLKTCSKAVGLAGIRLGFAVSNEKITNALLAVKSPYNVNTLTQCVGEVILSNQQYLISCIEKIIFSRDSLYKGLLKLFANTDIIEQVYKTETNFVFIKTNYSKSIFKALCRRSVIVRETDGYLRITAGTKKENEKALNALSKIIAAIEYQNEKDTAKE